MPKRDQNYVQKYNFALKKKNLLSYIIFTKYEYELI